MPDTATSLQTLLKNAVAAHGAGNLSEAETLYREVLARDAEQPTALYLLGVMALQVGRPEVATGLIARSLERQPGNAEAQYNLGNAFLALGRQAEAERCFLETIRLQPDYVSAHYNLGNLQQNAGALDAAEESYRAAAHHAPGLGQAWCNLGLVLGEQGRLEEAVAAYRTGLDAVPTLAEGHNNLGNALSCLDRKQEALASYRDALSANPLFGTAYRNLGTTLQDVGEGAVAVLPFRRALLIDPGRAENCYNFGTLLEGGGEETVWFRRALALQPDYTAARYNLGTAYLATRAFEEALQAFTEVVARVPDHAKAWGNLGVAAQKRGDLVPAMAAYRTALCLEPGHSGTIANAVSILEKLVDLDGATKLARAGLAVAPLSPTLLGALGLVWQVRGDERAEALLRCAIIAAPEELSQYLNLSLTWRENNRIFDAETPLRWALYIAPQDGRVLGHLGSLLAETARFREALESGTRAVELEPDNPDLHKVLLFFLHYVPDLDPDIYRGAYRRFDEEIGWPLRCRWVRHGNRRDPEKRLKIGYVGATFQRHSSASFFLPLLRNHDHERFEIYNYATYRRSADLFTEQMRDLSDHWLPTFGTSDRDLVEQIRSDEIDVLVDLCGHTMGNRLPVFAEKPAPVSFHWLDHGVTTGLTAIDYFLGDPVFTPEGSDALFSEQVWNLPRTVFPYEPLNPDEDVVPTPALENGCVTFGILSRSIRINEDAIRLWSRILRALPETRFALFSQSCRDPAVVDEITRRFGVCGIGKERLDIGFCPRAADAHARIDILLDTFPHNAGVTFYECVYMGLPAVTLRGKPAIGTVGSSMLTQLGRTEWIAESEDAYVRIACDLASDIPRLAELRRGLRGEMEASPLMDGTAFARDFEAACRQMWQKWCASGTSQPSS